MDFSRQRRGIRKRRLLFPFYRLIEQKKGNSFVLFSDQSKQAILILNSKFEVGTSPWSYGYGRKVVRGVEFKIGRPTPVRRELLPIHSFVPLGKLPILVGIEKLGTK